MATLINADRLLVCDGCGAVVRESLNSRSASDRCGIAYSYESSPGQFYPCEGKLRAYFDLMERKGQPA